MDRFLPKTLLRTEKIKYIRRTQKPAAVMVWADISGNGKSTSVMVWAGSSGN